MATTTPYECFGFEASPERMIPLAVVFSTSTISSTTLLFNGFNMYVPPRFSTLPI